MKHIFIIMLLAMLLMLPCYATESEQGVGQAPTPVEDEVNGTADASTEAEGEDETVEAEDEQKGGMTPEEFEAFVNEKIVPYVIVAVSAVAAIYVAISPILAKIKASSDKFDTATGGLSEANAQGKAAKEQSASMLAELQAERAAQRVEQTAFENRVAAQMQSMIDTVQNALGVANVQTREIRDMVQIGFCNNKDLVERGYAKQIARIAQGKGMTDESALIPPSEVEATPEGEARESGEQDGEEVDGHEQGQDQASA